MWYEVAGVVVVFVWLWLVVSVACFVLWSGLVGSARLDDLSSQKTGKDRRMERLVKSLMVVLMCCAAVPLVVSAEKVYLGQACWRLGTFDDYLVLDVFYEDLPKGQETLVPKGAWDFMFQAEWVGPLPDGTIVYTLQGGGTGQETPDGLEVVMSLTMRNVHPVAFGANPIVRLSNNTVLSTMAGKFGIDAVGAASFRNGGNWLPMTCPLDSTEPQVFSIQTYTGKLAGLEPAQ